MQFLTARGCHEGEYRIRVNRNRRGYWFDDFHFATAPDATAEGIGCWWNSDPAKSCFKFLRADIEIGAHRGCALTLERGFRICSVSFTVPFAKYHDIDTTPEAVHQNVSYCVAEYVLPRLQAVDPLRPNWLTPDVIALAQGLHANPTTDGCPILSDALRDAGCEDPLVHDHLQMCPDHGPSCWVVEMILQQTRTAGA